MESHERKMMPGLVRWVWHSCAELDPRQVGWVGDSAGELGLGLLCVADFAGCTQTQRSTSGIHLAAHGATTIVPVTASCAAQKATATSTPEAEQAALNKGYRTAMFAAPGLFEILCPRGLFAVLRPRSLHPLVGGDNQAAIMVINSGRNPSMRRLGRCQRVGLAWLHKRLGVHPGNGRAVYFYEGTRNMSADVCTKSFSSAAPWMHAIRLINVSPGEFLNGPEGILSWVAQRRN